MSPERAAACKKKEREGRQNLRKQMSSVEAASQKRKETEKRKVRRMESLRSLEEHRANFNLECMDADTNFHAFEHHPETSVLLYHLNSEHDKFRKLDELLVAGVRQGGEFIQNKEDFHQLVEEIHHEVLSPEEQETLVNDFLEKQGRHVQWEKKDDSLSLLGLPDSVEGHHLVCGMCGIKSVHGRYGRMCGVVFLEDLPPCIELTEDQKSEFEQWKLQEPLKLPINEEGDMQEFQLHKLQSVYQSLALNKSFHLHPKFVHMAMEPNAGQMKECAVLCHSCHTWHLDTKKAKSKSAIVPPPLSIAAGIDFGDIHHLRLLEKPTVAEASILAKHRHFHNVVSIRDNRREGTRSDYTMSQIRAHSIFFRHDAPEVASLAMLMEKVTNHDSEWVADMLKKSLSNQLVGPESQVEKIGQKAKKQKLLSARPHIIYQRLTIYQELNGLYHNDLPVLLPSFEQFCNVFGAVSDSLIRDASQVTDEGVINADLVQGDDVAQVRSGVLTNADVEALNQKDDHVPAFLCDSMPMTSSFLMEPQSVCSPALDETLKEEMMLQHIIDAANAFGVKLRNKDGNDGDDDHKEDNLHLVHGGVHLSEREENPLNEFTDMENLLTGGFPDVFLFGRAYGMVSHLSAAQLEHLLLQHTCAAAMDHELLFYLFNCKERHTVINNFVARVRKDPKAFEEFARLVRHEEFHEKIRVAAENPKSATAKEVLRTVLPILSFGAKNTIAGALTDSTSLSRAMAQSKRYGPPGTLLTVTPDDVNSPSGFHFACKSFNNTSFPAVATEEFFQAIQQGSEFADSVGHVKVPLNYTRRVHRVTGNPVAVALEFRALIENVLTILIGCPMDFQPGTNSKQV